MASSRKQACSKVLGLRVGGQRRNQFGLALTRTSDGPRRVGGRAGGELAEDCGVIGKEREAARHARGIARRSGRAERVDGLNMVHLTG
jgi:hypothetical protein